MIRYSSQLLLTIAFVVSPAGLMAQEPPTEKPNAEKSAAASGATQPPQSEQATTPPTVTPAKIPPPETPPAQAATEIKQAAQEAAAAKTVTQKEEPEKEIAAKKPAAKQAAAKKPAAKKPAAKQAAAKVKPKERSEQPQAAQEAAKKVAAQKAEPPAPKPTLPTAWVNTLQWRSIGPANMSGRIPALAVYEKEPNTWWAASASGGLLKTVNNGVTFEHQFDREATVSIGDVQVAPSDPNIVWVGTGEANPRNSVSWGNGVYKSTDGGKTWKNMGLEKTFQIGRMAIHPQDPNIVYVGALGRLWGPNEDRGLYKTTDGGETWNKILYVDDKTGVIDVQMNLKSPDTLLVSTYERQRDGFDDNDPAKKFGPGSGVYLTRDGGKKFQKVTKGLPSCNLGRIGISIYRKDPRQVYLVLESEKIGQVPETAGYAGIRGEDADIGARLTEVVAQGPAEQAGLKTGDIVFGINGKTVHSYDQLIQAIDALREGDKLKLTVSRDRKELQMELKLGKRPEPRKQQPQRQPTTAQTPQDLARAGSKYAASLGGQRENQVQGPEAAQYGGIYHSKDGGVSWRRINSLNPRPMYYSQIRVDPSNNQYIWVLGTSLYLSKDGGVTFSSENTARGIHVDHHSMWIDPNNGNHTILGNDGGIHVTYDRGLNWDHLNHVAIGQFYHVAVGPRRDYRVYGGLQDNGSWGGPHRGPDGGGTINTDWISVGGGDGFVCAVDPEDADLVYSESQGGATGRYDLRTGARSSMRPRPPQGTRYRFNWKTPFILSPHNSRVYYSAGNYVFRSPYKGNNLEAISPEITLTDKGSASALAESPAEEGVLYAGTTDGALWVTQDGGHTWTNLFGKEQDDKADSEASTAKEPTSDKEPKKEPAGEPSKKPEPLPAQPPGGGNRGFVEMLLQQDANGDGKLQRDEMPERIARMFDRLDANGDDVIDQAELNAMPPRSGRGRGGPPPGGGRGGPAAQAARPQPAEPQPAPVSAKDTESPPPVVADDIVSGTWQGKFESENMPAERATFTLVLRMNSQAQLTGSFKSAMSEGDGDGKFNLADKSIQFTVETERGTIDLTGNVAETGLSGNVEVNSGAFSVPFTAKRAGPAPAAKANQPAAAQGKSLQQLLPGPRWVSSIEASRFQRGRVYITCDGHRSDDDKPYVFTSEDYGRSWQSLLANLPESVGSTRVIREDVRNQNVLYLGTEFSIWISIDRGQSWTRLNSNLPTVAVHEVAIHPTAGEIVAATHGRSLWVLDVAALRQLSAETIAEAVKLYQPQPAVKWRSQPRRGSAGTRQFAGENPPYGAKIYYSLAKDVESVIVHVTDIEGKVIREIEGDPKAGLHSVLWDLRQVRPTRGTSNSAQQRSRRGGTATAGKYLVTLIVDDQEFKTVLTVEDDPDAPAT